MSLPATASVRAEFTTGCLLLAGLVRVRIKDSGSLLAVCGFIVLGVVTLCIIWVLVDKTQGF